MKELYRNDIFILNMFEDRSIILYEYEPLFDAGWCISLVAPINALGFCKAFKKMGLL